MRLVVFGASGATGLQLTAQALDAGHDVTAFVRTPAKLGALEERVRVVKGDVVDRASVERATAGQQAAIVALGATNPLRRMPSLVVGMHNILMALEEAQIARLVYLSADTVDRHSLNFIPRNIIVPLFLAATAADHRLGRSDDRPKSDRMGNRPPPDAHERRPDRTISCRRTPADEGANSATVAR